MLDFILEALTRLPTNAFGLLVGSSMVVGMVVAERRSVKLGVEKGEMTLVSWVVLVAGMLLAHVVAVLAYEPQRVAEDPWLILRFWDGLSSVGGFVGGFVGGAVFLLVRKRTPWTFANPAGWGLAIGWCVARMGCVIVFDHPGELSDAPWAMYYDGGSSGLAPGMRHNLALYELVACLGLVGWTWARRKGPRFEGRTLIEWGALYMPIRFGLDFMRAADRTYAGLTPAQYACVGLFVLCAGLWVLGSRRGASQDPD